jgi:GT2 family glycosyltransferase
MATTPQRALLRTPQRRHSIAVPQVSIVVVNYCQWLNTERLSQQIIESDCFDPNTSELIVVDNDSPFNPAIARLRRHPDISFHRFHRNTGFAKAVNEGCRLARGRWVLLLNPDTSIEAGFLDQLNLLCRTLEHQDPTIGVIGLTLEHADGTLQASSGPPPTLMRTLSGLFLPRSARRCRVLETTNRVSVPWVTGCGMLIRRECWESLGGLDEAYFLYYEDADFCRRAWEQGWSVWFEPSIRIKHYNPLHTRPLPPELRLMTRHALLTYAHRHWGKGAAKVLTGVIWLESLARHLKAICTRRPSKPHQHLRQLASEWWREKGPLAQARVRGVATELRHCAGREDGTGC